MAQLYHANKFKPKQLVIKVWMLLL